MVDGGTSCEGYASDITRTFVLGKASQRQTDVWNLEKKAQDAAFAAVKIGAPCEQVDAAARAVIENGGFSRQYRPYLLKKGLFKPWKYLLWCCKRISLKKAVEKKVQPFNPGSYLCKHTRIFALAEELKKFLNFIQAKPML
jgi:methionine aminopeptidase